MYRLAAAKMHHGGLTQRRISIGGGPKQLLTVYSQSDFARDGGLLSCGPHGRFDLYVAVNRGDHGLGAAPKMRP